MSDHHIFIERLSSAGDLAGVFEYDDDTGYFYLYDMRKPLGEKILDSIWILNYNTDLRASEIAVRWNADESHVGLFVRGELWAVFDLVARKKFGGQYQKGVRPQIPRRLGKLFVFP